MLVLTRKRDEQIVIGDNIVITIVKIDMGRVRVGIEAPREVPVYRRELTHPDPHDAVAHSAGAESPHRTD
jgi:carbon storage regulator